jgi:hypothetical protein
VPIRTAELNSTEPKTVELTAVELKTASRRCMSRSGGSDDFKGSYQKSAAVASG